MDLILVRGLPGSGKSTFGKSLGCPCFEADMYFINEECGYKIIRLFKGLNFISNTYSFCNSAFNTQFTQNISNDGIALKDIKAGEEILEWYEENIYL